MNKRTRQYVGLIAAVMAYYIVHEGAHLLYAVSLGVFKQINFMGMGIQIDVHSEQMTHLQLGFFCLSGSAATTVFAYLLVAMTGQIGKSSSKVFKACAYYITIAVLLIDPLYLSLLCGFFGGGDMNGISLLISETAARITYAVILLINIIVFVKIVLPKYKLAFRS